MLYDLDNKFDDYVAGRHVSEDIPDDLLEELKKINEEIKEYMGKDYFDFPR